MKESLVQPIQINQRTIIVDILRGWAIFGVVLMNYYDFFTLDRNWETFKPDGITNGLMYVISIVFAAKSWTLLSLLFGYGFAVLMDNVSKKGHHPYCFFAGRMFWLMVLAIINSALFFGDILKDYAALGLLMLVFYRSSAKTTFITSIILLLALPGIVAYVGSLNDTGWSRMEKLFPLYHSRNLIDVLTFGLKGTYFAQMISKGYLYSVHVVMIICFLWGFTLYKINFFENLTSKLKYIKRTFWICLAIAVFLSFILPMADKLGLTFLKYYRLRYWVILSTMLAIACGICWLFVAEKLKSFFNHLAFMGKMTLTNYMTQNLIGMLVFSGFGLGLWNKMPLWFYILLAISVYTLQVFVSKWWLTKYNYGPIEWIWRQLSYQKHLPLKKIKDKVV